MTILLVHALCQPYIARTHNIIDTLLFSNLALINIITFACYHTVRTRAGKQIATDYILALAVLQLILIYFPLLIMVVYITMMSFKLCCRRVGDIAEW